MGGFYIKDMNIGGQRWNVYVNGRCGVVAFSVSEEG